MAPAADKFESMLTGLASSITEVQITLASLLIKANENASSIQDLKISTIKADKDIDKLDDYIQNNQELKQDINLVNKRVEVLEGEVAELKAIRSQEVESKNEKLHITMAKLLDNMGTSFNYSATNGAVRIGKLPPGGIDNLKFPRIIKLS